MTTRNRTRQFGNIRKLPSGRWQARYLAPDGRRRSADVTFPTKADASAWLAKMETKTNAGEWRALSRPRELRHLRRALAGAPSGPSTTHPGLYDGLWRRWLSPAWSEVPLSKMTTEAWRVWWVETTSAHPGSTQPAKAYRLARTMLNTAVEDGLLRVNPCRVKGAGRENAPERPIATPEQVADIVEAIDEPYRLMVQLAAFCSLRFGELTGLGRDRIDVLHRTVTVDRQAIELADGTVQFGPPKSAEGRAWSPSRSARADGRGAPRCSCGRPGRLPRIHQPRRAPARWSAGPWFPSTTLEVSPPLAGSLSCGRRVRAPTSTTCAVPERRGQPRTAPPCVS